MGALLILFAVEEAALVGSQLDDVGIGGAGTDDGPGIGVQIVLHGGALILGGRNVHDFGKDCGDTVDIVESETDLDAGFVAAGLLRGAAGEEADGVGAPLGEDGLESCLLYTSQVVGVVQCPKPIEITREQLSGGVAQFEFDKVHR